MPTTDMVWDIPTLDMPTLDIPTLDMLDTMVTPDLLLMPTLPEPTTTGASVLNNGAYWW